eukprot:9684518-Alexandrium_andersonii.AAC.1
MGEAGDNPVAHEGRGLPSARVPAEGEGGGQRLAWRMDAHPAVGARQEAAAGARKGHAGREGP